jgi:plastocyanin
VSDHPTEPQAPESRERLLWPIAIPVVALVVIGAVLYLFSRVLLRVTPTAATITALVVAASILGVATLVASRPHVSGASLVSMVGGVAGIAMFAGGLALILGQPAEELQPAVVALAAPAGASNKGFEPNELSAPASYPFTIAFTNDDPGVQHNVVVTQQKTTDPAGALATGAPVVGPANADVTLSGLAQGSYYFFCEFHPTTMTGTLTVAGPPPAPGAPQGPVVTATDPTAFSPNTIELPAGQPGTITFDNEDPGITHNLDVYSDKDYTQSIAKTPDVTGVSSGQVALPALEAGTYYFRCDFHPVMTGTITVSGGGAGGGGGGPGGATPSGPPPSGGPSPSPGG